MHSFNLKYLGNNKLKSALKHIGKVLKVGSLYCKHLSLVFLLILCVEASGQEIKFDPDTINVGELTNLTFGDFKATADREMIFIDLDSLPNVQPDAIEPFADIELEDTSQSKKILVKSSGDIDRTIALRIFSTGRFIIRDENGNVVAQIVVRSVSIKEDNEVADIKPIVEATNKDLYIKGLIALLLLLSLLYYIYKKWRKQPKQESGVVAIPVEENITKKTLQALTQLKVEKAYLHIDAKAFETKIVEIIREYLAKKYTLPALTLTSAQLINLLRQDRRKFSHISDLESIFAVADLIKFAKAEVGHSLLEDAVDKAINFVQQNDSRA
jgi:hypothetical protein